MVRLGMTNTRMKDFYDLLVLAQQFTFDGPTLAAAIRATFARRGAPILESAPLALTLEFAADDGKQAEWEEFLKRNKLGSNAPMLHMAIEDLRSFLLPLVGMLAAGYRFRSPLDVWRPLAVTNWITLILRTRAHGHQSLDSPNSRSRGASHKLTFYLQRSKAMDDIWFIFAIKDKQPWHDCLDSRTTAAIGYEGLQHQRWTRKRRKEYT